MATFRFYDFPGGVEKGVIMRKRMIWEAQIKKETRGVELVARWKLCLAFAEDNVGSPSVMG